MSVGAGLGAERSILRETAAPLHDGASRLGLRHEAAEGPATDREELGAVVADGRTDPAGGHPSAQAAGLVDHDHAPPGRDEFPRRA